ncbi:MAG TPA: tetratricopeptide repeat protein [Anaeromyxobacteraceae bacterium]|nr:tetratricopeptide repeat protein [Anaeromyxobacteraceae bacterium]
MSLSVRPNDEPALDPAALAEDVDLALEVRREILLLDARLERMTHHELLGVGRRATAEEARAAYLERVKRYHPDRHAGKRLGTFRARLDRITRRLTEAREVLSNPERRAEYERNTATPDDVVRIEVRRLEDELRAEERRSRLGRTNPLLARTTRVAELVKRGKDELAAGKPDRAANDFATALALDPRHVEARVLGEEARRRAASFRAESAWTEGLAAEASGRDGLALERFRQVLEGNPSHPRAALAATRAALRLGRVGEARELAQAAVRASPRTAAAHAALGEALAAAGEKGDAKKALERALEIDPRLDDAKVLLRKLRWSLFG